MSTYDKCSNSLKIFAKQQQPFTAVYLPARRVDGQRPGLVQILPHQDFAGRAVQASDLDPVVLGVGPVDVVSHPVHRHPPLGEVQAQLYDVLHGAAIHERPADGLLLL